jgi:L-2-hydroxyglutarate oxidase
VDVAVIGAGIVGLATARELLRRRPGLSLVVLEKEAELAAHQTGHNSGVIHSGIYYKPGSLKAQTCTRGRELLYRFLGEEGLAHERCGKIVVATRPEEIPALDELERRGQRNGLSGLVRLSPEALREREPHVAGASGLLVPETGIVSYRAVAEAYARIVVHGGGEVRTGVRVARVVRDGRELVVETTQGELRCRCLVGCAGLHSDRMARRSGLEPYVRIVPFRGEYYELVPDKRYLVKHLVYPVPNPAFPFLGVHFTRMIQGGIEAGPNAVLSLKREGYGKASFSVVDAASTLGYGGFWRMARKYWRTGLGELHRSWSRHAFVRALQALVPELQPEDVVPSGAGVRAQALDPHGALVDDFHIVDAPGMVHVLNAPSPAATASLAIAESIADRVEGQLG